MTGAGGRALRLLGLWALLAGALVALAPGLLADPFLRSDDFLALRAEAALYEWKTLAKGRWLNWLWLLREGPTDRQAVMALHLAGWSLTAAAAGAGAFRADAGPGRALVLGLAVLLMPQAADMAAWPATLALPNLLVAGFAAVAALAPVRVLPAALGLLAPLALMGHSTAALMMLALALVAADWSDPRARLAPLLAVFVGALALGTLAMFTLNWLVHGHFGLRLGDWLAVDPASDAAGLARNAAGALGWLWAMLRHMALGQEGLALGLAGAAALALGALGRLRPAEAGRWLAVAAVVTGGLLAPGVIEGVEAPPRASGPLWLLLAALFAGLARAAGRGAAGGLALALLAVMALAGGVLWHALHQGAFAPYQAMTRGLAARIAEAAPGPVDRLLVRGEVAALPATGPLQFAIGFEMRLEDLTGWEVHLCSDQARDLARGVRPMRQPWTEPPMRAWEAKRQADLAACAAHAGALATLPAWPAPGAMAPLGPGVMGLALPAAADGAR